MRPEVIRADSIDLQDHDAPSAKDRSRLHPSPLKTSTTSHNNTHFAPHQAETLREVAAETAEAESRSPRVSWVPGEGGDSQQYDEDLADGIVRSLGGAQAQALDHSNTEGSTMHYQQDDLAVAQNGGHTAQHHSGGGHHHDNGGMEDDGHDDDDDDDMDDDDDDDMMDKISSSPSIEDEDIDFEFVYALHTFIATVEGQANATKGDTMVLLDDSNSYWWLVRIVKDSSIGYLPAEHIETPTERLARLNKHRNIDLSATMLGDQADKSKNPLKTALRRRKAKGVTFAEPTYYDYSDYDYDTEDEEEADGEYYAQQHQESQEQQQQQQDDTQKDEPQTAQVQQQQQHQQQQIQKSATQGPQQTQQVTASDQQANGRSEQDKASAQVAPLRPRAQPTENGSVKPNPNESVAEAAARAANKNADDTFETNGVDGPKRSKDGTVRDSFFNDPVETKKITLTPGLLRDGDRPSLDSKELRTRPSLDKLEQDPVVVKDDGKKKPKDKKEKDKKPGGFRGLFSRKDKKTRDDDDDSFGKPSSDPTLDSSEREAMEAAILGDQPSPERVSSAPTRSGSKLQKPQPRVEPSPTRKGMPREQTNGMELSAFLNENRVNDVSNNPPSTLRSATGHDAAMGGAAKTRSNPAVDSGSKVQRQLGINAPTIGSRPQQTAKPKQRMELDDSDLDDEPDHIQQAGNPQSRLLAQQSQSATRSTSRPERPHIPGAFPDSYLSALSTASTIQPDKSQMPQPERLSESPVQVSPIAPSTHQVPPLVGDTSSQDDHSSPVSSPSPELIDRGGTETTNASQHRKEDSITTSTTSATTASTWNDTSLRAFFDSGTDIRDLLAVVYDKTDVEPVGSDHPVVGTLFKEQNAKLAEITTQLDNMLGDWLARKQRMRGTI